MPVRNGQLRRGNWTLPGAAKRKKSEMGMPGWAVVVVGPQTVTQLQKLGRGHSVTVAGR